MPKSNSKLIDNIEAKLLQAQSMASIALDNHNYKCAGYDEPFINHVHMGNLLWAVIDLINNACTELQEIDVKEAQIMTRITLEQQDEIIERLSKAEAILACFSSAIDPSAIVKASDKTIQNTVWLLSDLVCETHQIALNKGGKK